MRRPTSHFFLPALSLIMLFACLPNLAIAEDVPIVDGKLWSQSSAVEKKSYLIGVSNLVSLEYAYQTKSKTPPNDEQTTIQRFFNDVDEISLDEIIQRINGWYDKNPDRLEMAVLAVIWVDMVEPNPEEMTRSPTRQETQMKAHLKNPVIGLTMLVLAGCATVGGGLVGAGIGAIAGDAKMGAAVGATAGAVVDIFGR